MKEIAKSNLYIYGIIILLAVLESFSMSSLKISKGYDVYLIVSILCFVSLVFLFRELLKYKNLSTYIFIPFRNYTACESKCFLIYKESFQQKKNRINNGSNRNNINVLSFALINKKFYNYYFYFSNNFFTTSLLLDYALLLDNRCCCFNWLHLF